jgi:hypothetical protein
MRIEEMQHGMIVVMEDSHRTNENDDLSFIVVRKQNGELDLYGIHNAESFAVNTYSYQFRIATKEEQEKAMSLLNHKADKLSFERAHQKLTEHYVRSSEMVVLLNNRLI